MPRRDNRIAQSASIGPISRAPAGARGELINHLQDDSERRPVGLTSRPSSPITGELWTGRGRDEAAVGEKYALITCSNSEVLACRASECIHNEDIELAIRIHQDARAPRAGRAAAAGSGLARWFATPNNRCRARDAFVSNTYS